MLIGHADVIEDLSWSPDGQYLASAARDSVRVWDTVSGSLVRTFDAYSSAVGWSPDGRTLAFAVSWVCQIALLLAIL